MGLKNLLFKLRNVSLLFLLVLLLFKPVSLTVVSAQVTTLSVQPNPAYIFLNGSNTVTLDLYVTDAVNLQSCDIYIAYDPEILQLTSWAHGNLLVQPIMVLGGDVDEEPGYFYITFIKMGPPPGNGEGVLLSLTFTGTGYGESPVTITHAVFSNPQGVKTYPVLQSGSLMTAYDPSIVFNSSLTGAVSLQGRVQREGVPVTLERGIYVGQGPFPLISSSSISGNLSQSPMAMDAYLITTNQPGYLNLSADSNKVKGVLAAPTVLSDLTLLAGDLNGDGEIGVLDLAIVAGWFGQTGDALAGDVNSDGVVNARDLALVAGNFGQTSATAYGGWLP